MEVVPMRNDIPSALPIVVSPQLDENTSASTHNSTTTHTTTAPIESALSGSSANENDNDNDNDNDGQDKDEGPHKKKRKRRPTGVFKCDFEGCDKTFTRAEHLSRHKLNHNPTVIYRCPWEGCTKSFVRSDLKERHLKRHEARKLKEEAKLLNQANGIAKKRKTKTKPKSSTATTSTTVTNTTTTESEEQNSNKERDDKQLPKQEQKKIPINALDSIILPNIEDSNPVNIHNYDDNSHVSAASQEVDALRHGSITGAQLSNKRNFFIHDTDSFMTQAPDIATSVDHGTSTGTGTGTASPSHLINWLFDESQLNQELGSIDGVPNLNPGNFFNTDDDPFGLSSNLLNDILIIPPNFPNPVHQSLITPEISQKLVNLVPKIADHPYFHQMDHFLELYWNCFHVQYPILHKPSFNTFTCPPILLICMIMTGASYATTEPNRKYDLNPRDFSDIIADPLRWIIFQCKDFQAPAKYWVVQSLLLLETYERLSTNRVLHERAYVHHGTTIQLLRRSPGLGGNPLHNKTEYFKNKNGTIWEKWIEFESTKRTALFALFIDATHSIVFGYHLMLGCHQIQLNLPCDDELWESYLTAKEIPNKNDTLPFIVGLKKLLNREHVQTSRFGKKILLSGLLTIMFQMQQRDLQGSIIEFDQLRDTWKDTLSLAFDFWNCEIMKGCCNTNSSVFGKDALTIEKQTITPFTLREKDTRCKAAVYHMGQITLRIQHYDYYIYAGAPWRMNVEAEASDYELVEKKVKEWSGSVNGRISVIYAYMFLFEMFLSPQDSEQDFNYTNYNANSEAVFNRLNVLALSTLLVWAYNYSLDGSESSVLFNHEIEQVNLIPKEDGYSYLRRVRNELARFVKQPIHLTKPLDAVKYNNMMKVLAIHALPRVQNKKNMTGLLLMVSKIFKGCYWEVGNEFSRLIFHVCKRSFGSSKVRCDEMYKAVP